MAVFRVEKNRDYTVMSNHHLRNTDLSLKSKGLLSQMLSLPEEWDYTPGQTHECLFSLLCFIVKSYRLNICSKYFLAFILIQ